MRHIRHNRKDRNATHRNENKDAHKQLAYILLLMAFLALLRRMENRSCKIASYVQCVIIVFANSLAEVWYRQKLYQIYFLSLHIFV